MCYVLFKIDNIDFELSLTSFGVKFKINNFELHITHIYIMLPKYMIILIAIICILFVIIYYFILFWKAKNLELKIDYKGI